MNRKKFSCSTINFVERLKRSRIPRPNLPEQYPWKVLAALHQDLASFLTTDESDLLSQIIRDRDFTSYLLLEDCWGLQAINVLPQLDSASLAAKYQLATLIKKYQFPTDADKRQAAALEKFRAAEAQCHAYNSHEYMQLVQGSDFAADILTYARGFLLKLLGGRCPTKEILTKWSRHGPGANLDTSKDSNVYFKYANWPYSCTSAALPYAQFLIASDKRWLGALEDDYRERYSIPKHYIINRRKFWTDVFQVVEENKIAFVPKSAVIDRTIAIEPAMNLMLQLGVDGFIRTRLKRFGVDLDSQEKNQKMARLGSLRDDNESFVTIDLAAASDTISLKLCELLLPPDWYDYLLKLRSPNGDVKGEKFRYAKISSMGCGFTFVLESAIFAAFVYAAHRASHDVCDFQEGIAVYGDDLIVKKRVLPFVLRALKLGGFKINHEKSFYKGPARESCGTDWLMGLDVRPISMKKCPVETTHLFVDRNRLRRYLELTFGITNSHVVQRLDSWVPKILLGVRGPCSNESFDSFLHTPWEDVRFSLLSNKLNIHSKVSWKYGYWFFPILTVKAKPHQTTAYTFNKSKFLVSSGRNFHLRKLMHDLSPIDRPYGYGDEMKRSSIGSRFTVVQSHSTTVGITISETSYWSSDYSAY